MEIRIEQKWALEELAIALHGLKAVGISLRFTNGDMAICGSDSSVHLDDLTPEAIVKAFKRAEEDEQPLPVDAEDC